MCKVRTQGHNRICKNIGSSTVEPILAFAEQNTSLLEESWNTSNTHEPKEGNTEEVHGKAIVDAAVGLREIDPDGGEPI
jgi:hypothetical protein